jgi:hypothetical protein
MSISIINGNKTLFNLELTLDDEKIKINHDHNLIVFTWDDNFYKTDKIIHDLIENEMVSLFVHFDNSQSGYIQTIPFHSNTHTINQADVRGNLEISIVGVANKPCQIETIYPGTNYAFPINSQIIESNSSSNIILPIESENERTAESYIKCKHVDNLSSPYRLDYDNEKFILLNVKDEQIQKKWTSASKRHDFREKRNKESIGFSSSIWSPILFKILSHVYSNYETYNNGSKLWYKSLEKEGMINADKTSLYDDVAADPDDRYDFILKQVDEYIYGNQDSWTVELLFKTFSS